VFLFGVLHITTVSLAESSETVRKGEIYLYSSHIEGAFDNCNFSIKYINFEFHLIIIQ